MALVTRLPIDSTRVLAFAPLPIEKGIWMVAIELAAPGGRTLRILAVDLPSAIKLPRAQVASLASSYLNLYPSLQSPDLLLGDFNNLPDSVVFDSLPPTRPPSPAEAHGWLGTFPRGFPLWRIDGMRVSSQWEFQRYETLDLGVALHRAQLGVVVPKAVPTPFPPHHEE
jgi:endonuclease/exonuclease/phosphatase family metal-dependent hydrolase